jgi:D-arabinose 1-dehydrogenase-like Zn-dependent alcohol dehydrogenase
MGRRSFEGSSIGGFAELQEMLEVCFVHYVNAKRELIYIQVLIRHSTDWKREM